jgi:chromate transporter
LDAGTFTEIIAVAEMTPGPVAVNTATFVGFRLAGLGGAAAATLAVILVPTLVSGLLTVLLGRYAEVGAVAAVLRSLRPAACALLLAAALTVLRTVDWDQRAALIAVLAAWALLRRVNPLLVIGGAAALGVLLF